MTEITYDDRRRLADQYKAEGLVDIANWVRSGSADQSTHTPALKALATTRAELAAAHALIHQLGENAAKAAGEYAEEVGRLRSLLAEITPPRLCGESHEPYPEGKTTIPMGWDWLRRVRAALTEPTDG